ncbi:iron ABC transporter permease [Paenibacillus thiaminolyticus]|uniref:iron ABC transporter permease n=1 Tax=Paenibacillus thiaminolyticus TaxID=49283 RepID=UPI002175F289|nr:iron ABC transporter permease [Paenibacillus thiaminolyticus]
MQRDRFLLLGTVAILAGAGVAIGGPIGFIALMAPHIARRFAGVTYGLLIPTSELVGAILIVIADTAARTVMSPLDIPVGVFTAAIGAPFLVILLLRRKRSGE